MRNSMFGTLAIVSVLFLSSCASTPPGPATCDKGVSTVTSGGQAALHLTLPPGAKSYDNKGTFVFVDAKEKLRFYVWPVSGLQKPEDAVGRVGEIIKSEFVEFKPAETKDLTVAGKPAKQLSGPGKEADDGDPGNAVVVLFSVDGKVFAACVHGEGIPPATVREFMMTTIQTARP